MSNLLGNISPSDSQERIELIQDSLERYIESYKNELSYLIKPLISTESNNDEFFSLNELKNYINTLEGTVNASLGQIMF